MNNGRSHDVNCVGALSSFHAVVNCDHSDVSAPAPFLVVMKKDLCTGCPLMDRYGKCHWQKGEYCKLIKSY